MTNSSLGAFSATILPLIAILVNCSNSDLESQETKWPDGSVHEKWSAVQSEDEILIRQGEYQSWYENGQLYEEGEFLNDKRHGLWTKWHGTDPNVKIMEGNYVNGQMDGRWYYWMDPSHMNPDDTTSHHMHMTDNEHAAPFTHPKSHKFAEYRNGKPHGISISYHHNGQVADSFAYVDGKLEGKYVSYYDNGQAATIIEYQKGVRQGKQFIWDEQGKIISVIE